MTPEERKRLIALRLAQGQRYQDAQYAAEEAPEESGGGIGDIGGNILGQAVGNKLLPEAASAAPSTALSSPQGIIATRAYTPGAEAAGAPGLTSGYGIPATAAVVGGYHGVKGIREGDPTRATLGGAASGAGIGFMAGGPIGAGVGAGIGGLIGLGGSLMNQHKTEVEQKRLNKLEQQGISTFGAGQPKRYVDKGKSIRPDLASDFVGNDPSGVFVNNKFSNSRNESDLTGKDIVGYAAFSEKFGNDWKNFSPEQREAVANAALAKGLVREHHGTIDVNFDPKFTFEARQLISKAKKK